MNKFWKCLQSVFTVCDSCSLVKERRDKREQVLEVLIVVDSALAELCAFEEHSPWADGTEDTIQSCKLGLRFFRMFLMSLFTLEEIFISVNHICEAILEISHLVDSSYLTNTNLTFEGLSNVQSILFGSAALSRLEDIFFVSGDWDLDLQDRIQLCKPKIEESCELLLQCSLRCNSSKKKQTRKFLGVVLENLKDLYKYRTDDEIDLLKNQIEALEKKLRLLHNLLNLIPKQWRSFKEMQEFKVAVHAFAHYSASLVFLYWVKMKSVDEEMATKLNLLLSNVLQQIKPCDPIFKALYFRFLKEMKLMQTDPLLLEQIVQIFLGLLLEDSVYVLTDGFQVLEECLLCFVAFLANPPDQYAEDEELMMVMAEIKVLVKEGLYLVLTGDDLKEDFSTANGCLSDFMRKVELVKGKIRRVYDQIWDSFSCDFPKTDGLGFFDFLLQNLGFLKEKLRRDTDFIPFAKDLIIKIEEELMSLRTYLNDLFEQQKEQIELKDTWLEVINLAYQAEYAINSCSVNGHPSWYNMARLIGVLDEIKAVKIKLKKIDGRNTHDGGVLSCSPVALNNVPKDPWASCFNQVIVGLEDEINIIVEKLIQGSRILDIVAIVGMAGLGKTTLASKVYNALVVRNHFHIFAYCIVSQVHNTRRILLDILSDIRGEDDKMYDMMEEDLAEMLYKCLKGRRFLIVMDDIWDVKAWDAVKRSLPNDQNGSRVIFTTRIHIVALQAKKDCIIHHLRFLSDEESWELLRKKAFHAEDCPTSLSEVGKMIANKCKGLPLTIVLIAGILARTERSLSWWKNISETVSSYVSMEGCIDVLELSYQHLPEYLKPCFLYFGAFTEDALIRVNKLTLLWIAEGFVQNSNKKNLENLAKEYLCDLVDRSLVIASMRSSYGGIKGCRIHDLVHEFCQRKAQEENFFRLMDGYEAFNSSSSRVRNQYRVCVHKKEKYLSYDTDIGTSIHSLLYSGKGGIYRCDHPFVSNLNLVQVMDLDESEFHTDKVIDSLIHLRFLATSFIASQDTYSISNLWNLESLILTGVRDFPMELPATIWNMTRLRHVDVGRCYLSNSRAENREAYPQMVNLESFSSLNIFTTKDLEDLLQMSPSLRKLSFHYFYKEELDMGSHNILESLGNIHFPELDSLNNLESLKVSWSRQLSLSPFSFPSTLKKLSLSGGSLRWMYLPVISKMPCLEVLKLLNKAFVGLKLDMEDTEFPKLKFLKLHALNLEMWIASCESFPSLEVLIVSRCYNLNTIPPCFGEMLTLKRIEVYVSPKAAASVVEIQEAQKDFGNEELEIVVWKNPYHK